MYVCYVPNLLFCTYNLLIDLYHKMENIKNVQWHYSTSRWKYVHIKWVTHCQSHCKDFTEVLELI